MLLTEYLNESQLIAMKVHGYVKEQIDPQYPYLRILNYTQKAQFEQVWNDVTEKCRGLIYNAETGVIVARPFRKFFNYGQPGAPDLSLDQEVTVMDKMDGSLGILYRVPGTLNFGIATRGSFDSDQARHANQILNEKYAQWVYDNVAALSLVTPLFEIVYPENRIVCNYGDMDDLVLLGAEVLTSEKTWDADQARIFFDWPGPVAETFDYETFGEALAAPSRKGAEGFVVYVPKTGARIKIKQEDYVALHRIVTGLNARTVWEAAKQDVKHPEAFLEGIPDEFHPWVKQIWDDLASKVRARDLEISAEYDRIFRQVLDRMGGANTREREFRKEFALTVKDHPWKSYFFSLLTDKLILSKLWEEFKPAGNIVPANHNFSEDVA